MEESGSIIKVAALLLCPCEQEEEEEKTAEHLILQRKRLCNQRNEEIKQIRNACGNWPTKPETPVNNYLHIFVIFVKSMDFTGLQ